ncbi:serpin family protein, partial [Bacteroidota bacterium]
RHAVNIYLPKFRFDYSDEDLHEEFKLLGIKKAFSGSADFTKIIASGGIFISQIIHKTYIDVNERGAEAAAATVIVFSRGNNPITFEADRPFVFIIKNNETGANIFLGKVAKPVYKEEKKSGAGEITGIKNQEFDSPYSIHYNSMNNIIQITKNQPASIVEMLEIDLIDMSGKVLRSWKINKEFNDPLFIRIPEFEKSMYLLRLNNGGIVQTKKILVN